MARQSYKTHILTLFSSKDNQSLDIGRILWAAGALVFFVLSFISLWKGQPFDPASWGTAFAAILAGGGAALGFKSKAEPSGDDPK